MTTKQTATKHTAGNNRFVTLTEIALLREAEAALGETDLRPRELVAELHEAEDTAATLKAQRDELAAALAGLIAEMAGLPHSLGYEFTHLPAARALLSRLNDKGEGL